MTATVLRSLLIAALITSAAVHLERWLAGYRYLRSTIGDTEYLIIGPLFLVNVAAGLAIAIGVGVWRHWLPLLAALGFGAGVLRLWHSRPLRTADAAAMAGSGVDRGGR